MEEELGAAPGVNTWEQTSEKANSNQPVAPGATDTGAGADAGADDDVLLELEPSVATLRVGAGRAAPFWALAPSAGKPSKVHVEVEMLVRVTVSYVVPAVACQFATVPVSWAPTHPGGPAATVVVEPEVIGVLCWEEVWVGLP